MSTKWNKKEICNTWATTSQPGILAWSLNCSANGNKQLVGSWQPDAQPTELSVRDLIMVEIKFILTLINSFDTKFKSSVHEVW